MIQLGESLTLEFKSSLQWDMIHNRQNTALRGSVVKTIAAFLNSDGGTLVVGAADQGTICGIEPDLKLVQGSQDRFEQLLSTLIFQYLGAAVTPLCKFRFEDVEGRIVFIVDVERFVEPVFAKTEKGREFYIRVGNTTRALDTEAALGYIEARGAGAWRWHRLAMCRRAGLQLGRALRLRHVLQPY